VQDGVILRDMSGGGWAKLSGCECSTEIACVFLCERLIGQGKTPNSNLDGGREIDGVCVCVMKMPMEKGDLYVCERDCTIHSDITISRLRMCLAQT